MNHLCRLLTTTISLFFTVVPPTGTTFLTDLSIVRDSMDIHVGKRVRMECELNSSTITDHRKGLWLRLEDAEVFFYATSRISPDQRFQIEERSRLQIVNSSSSSELLIYSLIIDEVRSQDQGTYSCQADNRIIKLFILNLVERPSFVTDEYNILYRTKIGTNLSIACQSQGKPSPSIRWTKKIDETSRIPLIACSAPTTACPLTFTDVNRWHYGTYECVATNIAGTISRFYEVDVQFPPVVSSPSMRFSHSIGDSVTLDCWIDGNPSPDIRWFHRFSNSISEEIDLSRQFSSNSPLQTDHWFIKQEQFNATRWKTSLFIQHIPLHLLNSLFLCRATNRYGHAEHSIRIVQTSFSSPSTTTTTTNRVEISSPVTIRLSSNRTEMQSSLSSDLRRSLSLLLFLGTCTLTRSLFPSVDSNE